MSLLQNIRFINANPVTRIGDTTDKQPSDMERLMNRFVGWANISNKSGIPDGYSAPYGWFLPLKDGGMSSFYQVTGSGGANASSYLATVKTFPALTIVGSGEITITTLLSLLVQLSTVGSADPLTGIGEIDSSTLLQALANLSTVGSSDPVGGAGEIETSPLNLIAWCTNVLTPIVGAGNIAATMKGWADMSSSITSAGELVTAQSCAAAVWSAIAASYNVADTMGQKLNSAAVGGIDYGDLADAVWTAGDRELTAGTKDNEIESILDLVQVIGKLTGHKVTKSGDIITIYEEDGVTIWREYNLALGGRVEV